MQRQSDMRLHETVLVYLLVRSWRTPFTPCMVIFLVHADHASMTFPRKKDPIIIMQFYGIFMYTME